MNSIEIPAFPPSADKAFNAVIVPQNNLYDFYTLKKQPDEFYKLLKTAEVSVFDVRDDLERFADDHKRQLSGMIGGMKVPYYLTYHPIGILKNARVHDFNIYAQDGRILLGCSKGIHLEYELQDTGRKVDLSQCAKHYYPGKSVYIYNHATNNFYHFIADCLYFYEILEDFVLKENYDRIIISGTERIAPYKWDLIKILYPKLVDKIVFQNKQSFHAEELAFVVLKPHYLFNEETSRFERGPLPDKSSKRMFIPQALIDLCNRAEKTIGSIPYEKRNNILIISRAGNKLRSIINEDELLKALEPLGATAPKMEEFSMLEQMQMMANARVIVGCHGAGMFNAVFLQKGAQAIECTTRHYASRNSDFRKISIMRDINYDFIYCDDHGDIVEFKQNTGNHLRLSQMGIQKIVEMCEEALTKPAPEG